MTSAAEDKRLEALFDLLTKGLKKKMEAGEATAADFQVVRQLLKDANYSFDRENPPESVKRLVDQLPDLDEDPDWPGNARPN